MKLIFNYDRNYKTHLPSAIALGTFDGIHLGHRKLIEELHHQKRLYGYQTVVYTFINHPLQLLNPEMEPQRIMLLGERIKEFSNMGIDLLVLNPFDEVFSQQTPQVFLKHLYDSFPVKSLIVGFNFRFGHKGAGDRSYLEQEAARTGIELVCVPPVEYKNEVVSSSLIRKKISEGKVAGAAELLAQPYFINGIVIRGYARGKELGFPTANLQYSTKKVLPENGVYLTKCRYKQKHYWGLTSVGTNPTFSTMGFHIETYLLDFDETIYGQHLHIRFYNWLRGEMKFDHVDDLIFQMEQDRIKAKKLIYKNP